MHSSEEGLIEVGIISYGLSDLFLLASKGHFTVVDVRVLSQRVIAPDNDVLHIFDSGFHLVSDLGDCAVLIQSSESSEVLLGDAGGIGRSNQSIGVGRVAYDEHLDGLFGDLINSLTLGFEDLGVFVQEVFALHARSSGLSSY